ncbi:hypothetical protein BDI24065_00855 [Burkholderia diffusa]|uniref:Uncharacterized protein n=1 Tax=Burkholderia diffusa TaxID=488732 RepID=A0A6P2HU45_9BURK|nr:hypothetical protein BDI24065_00855 [Burkholderia diffusa]
MFGPILFVGRARFRFWGAKIPIQEHFGKRERGNVCNSLMPIGKILRVLIVASEQFPSPNRRVLKFGGRVLGVITPVFTGDEQAVLNRDGIGYHRM